MKVEHAHTDWILKNSVSDTNYRAYISRLSDDELLYCIRNERRTTGLRQLLVEAKRRGLEIPTEGRRRA